MNLPAIAAKSLHSFQDHPVFGALYRHARKNLMRLFSPTARARWSHQQIDKQISQLFRDPAVQKYSSCKKGCDACCHTQVSASSDEAELLALKILRQEVKIDLDRLERQASVGNSARDWYQLSYKERRCVFLDDEGLCEAYTDRPAVCRTNYAVSPRELCSTEDGTEKPIRLLNTHAADMIVAASFYASKSGGTLPVMLVEALDRLCQKKKFSKHNQLNR